MTVTPLQLQTHSMCVCVCVFVCTLCWYSRMTWNHQGFFFPSTLSEWTSHLQPILTWRLQPHEFCVCAAVRLICWAPACVAFISVCVCLCVSVSHLWGTDYKGISTFFLTPNWSFFFFFSRPVDGSMAASLHSSCQLRWFSAVSENTQLSHLRVPFIGLWSVHFFEFLFWALICLPILISSGGTSWDMLFCFQQRRTLLETRSPAQINW